MLRRTWLRAVGSAEKALDTGMLNDKAGPGRFVLRVRQGVTFCRGLLTFFGDQQPEPWWSLQRQDGYMKAVTNHSATGSAMLVREVGGCARIAG